MARKTKEEAEATRVGILNAAELCFLEEGVFRTTLEHIAARAGYSRGAVYWHFKNKLEVLDAVMDRVELPIFSGLQQLTLAGGDWPLRGLREFLKSAFEEFERSPHARNAIEISFLRCEFVEETRAVLVRQQKGAALALEHMTQAFMQAQRLRQLRDGLDPAVCAMAIHCMIYGALREWRLNPNTVSLQRDGLTALDAALGGFAVAGALQEDREAASRRKAGRRAVAPRSR